MLLRDNNLTFAYNLRHPTYDIQCTTFEDFLHKLLTMDVIPCDEDMFDICGSLFIGVACAGIRKYIIFY